MKHKLPNESWRDYNKRLILADLGDMDNTHVEIIKTFQDAEVVPDYAEYGRIVLERIIFRIIIFLGIIAVIFAVWRWII